MKTLLLCFVPILACGQPLYRCPGDHGPIFQQLPCSEGEALSVKPITNGQGGQTKNLVHYVNTIETERHQLQAEAERTRKERVKNEAVEELAKERYREKAQHCDRYVGEYYRRQCYSTIENYRP